MIDQRLRELGITLPQASAPAANYLPYAIHGDLLYISGQLPTNAAGELTRGKLGATHDVAAGQEAARLCTINILAQARNALGGDLERIRQVVKITGFVASTPDFVEQHLVVNGASNLLVEVLGERGRHARAAVGMAALPLDAAVEVEAIIAIG
ncbi:Enamine deaminase RidA, house cleaning of reactive enamine intermediates, YjgF/YER057c/UK114 family [Faunimonas pinastri]|uniref:Enamine deaminase RidA, house cleaning of reactive enamine intermediates, YjgF/YER057c/UK114 family n=1 Tax=Faunimonas pinastri TaxID=1855383 RepID=A0A1H9CGW8_9HYPH|nr:RidA family protein [Faunimonas pinastri]SEQ00455.1 Enamine deaminase RidA, house cleaning of reactive enamine intermediates, YjgF/YER057c/UK114 family [Faunimonas pinastri]